MSGKLRLNGATSGYSELQAPDVAGDQTFTLPAVGGTLVVYQQGVWTPTFTYGINNSNFISTWVRFGNMVTLWARVQPSDTATAQSIGIQGIPYSSTSDNQINQVFIGSTMVAITSSTVPWVPYVMATSGIISFYPGVIATGYQQINYTAMNAGAEIITTVSYITDDTTFVPINGATIS